MSKSNAAGSHYQDMARRAGHRSVVCYTGFLDPEQIRLATIAAKENGVLFACNGGFDGAERAMAVFYSGELSEEWPFACVKLSWNNKFSHISHSDILGALMALGFERDRIGDILLGQDGAYVFSTIEIADYITRSIDTVGRATVRCEIVTEIPEMQLPTGEIIDATIASLRVDTLVASAFHISRGRAQELIHSGVVRRNYCEELRPDKTVDEGDLLSIRGIGRVRLNQIGSITSKGRIRIQYIKFTSKQ